MHWDMAPSSASHRVPKTQCSDRAQSSLVASGPTAPPPGGLAAARMSDRAESPAPSNEPPPRHRGSPIASGDHELVDYSWSAFWPWARERGLNGPREIENLIGQQVAGLSPAELRDLILAADPRPLTLS